MSDNLIRTEITAQLKTTKKSREFNEGVKDQVCECGGELVEQTDFLRLEDELGGQRDPCQKSMIRERLNHSSFLSTSESQQSQGDRCARSFEGPVF